MEIVVDCRGRDPEQELFAILECKFLGRRRHAIPSALMSSGTSFAGCRETFHLLEQSRAKYRIPTSTN